MKSDVVIRIINKDTAVNDCQSSYNCTIYHLSRRSQLQEILELYSLVQVFVIFSVI